MKFQTQTFDCQKYDTASNRKTPFNVAKYTFNYQSDAADKKFLDEIIQKGTELANKVNPGAANHSTQKRDYEKILNNCIAGILSEYLWKEFLNREKQTVSETPYINANNQIDLAIDSNGKKIEVRSSFPRNGIDFALCSSTSEFDVIGMYSNNYKPDEVQKDYYVRALYHLPKIKDYTTPDGRIVPIIEKLMDKMKVDGFEVFLTGGATWEMMTDNKVAQNKNFVPHDEVNIQRLQTGTSYRVVPFSKALDSLEVYDLIKNEK